MTQRQTESIPSEMAAVLLTEHGGPEVLEYREDVPVPVAGSGEVLIQVAAAGVNNTDINTRTGWYSKSSPGESTDEDGGWGGVPLQFPRIQGADVCGHIVAVGGGVDSTRVGERVLCTTMQQDPTSESAYGCRVIGSESDGGFAQFVVNPSVETFAINSDWTDVELASLPCAYSTAENMLHRIGVGSEDKVLITGASGGVGSAAVQLVKRRGAHVIAVAGAAKAAAVDELGADQVLPRGESLLEALGSNSVDVVVDLVAGPQWPELLELLKVGGRYITAGAIAGPMVELDVRTLYLKDLTLKGSTYQDREVFENLIGYVERNEIRPVVHQTYPLREIGQAQADFEAKGFVGKLVLIPPPVE